MADTPLLEVRNLKTYFFTPDGIVRAVNGVSYTLDDGEALGLVGESGCGKSVSALSLMRLIPTPPGKIVEGEVNFDGRDLLKVSDEEIRRAHPLMAAARHWLHPGETGEPRNRLHQAARHAVHNVIHHDQASPQGGVGAADRCLDVRVHEPSLASSRTKPAGLAEYGAV